MLLTSAVGGKNKNKNAKKIKRDEYDSKRNFPLEKI
jgi:hypothetical protein